MTAKGPDDGIEILEDEKEAQAAAAAPAPGLPEGSGRPKKGIQYDLFERMLEAQCSEVEIAGYFAVSVDTLRRRVKEHYGKGFAEVAQGMRGRGKAALRAAQFSSAINKGNVSMMMFLGKQYLGQSEAPEVEDSEERIIIERRVVTKRPEDKK